MFGIQGFQGFRTWDFAGNPSLLLIGCRAAGNTWIREIVVFIVTIIVIVISNGNRIVVIITITNNNSNSILGSCGPSPGPASAGFGRHY